MRGLSSAAGPWRRESGNGTGALPSHSRCPSRRYPKTPKHRLDNSSASIGALCFRSQAVPQDREGRSVQDLQRGRDRSPTGTLPAASHEPARKLTRGAKWPELNERFLPGWKEPIPVTRADAEDCFRLPFPSAEPRWYARVTTVTPEREQRSKHRR